MDKRRVKKQIGRLERIKTWQLLVLLLLTGLIAATFLRLNNIGMVERRAAVLSSDESGDTTAVFNNLYSLQRYSAAHMNASTKIIYLESSYKREAERLVEAAKSASTVNADVIRQADAVCRSQFPGYSQAYVQCNATEQAKISGNDQGAPTVEFPNPELYRHEYISPIWSPDFAGLSLLICIVITGVIILRLTVLSILRLLLYRHYSSI